MQRHIFAAAVLIFIMSFTVGGATAAYFNDGITLPLAEFTAGTVEIEVVEVSRDGTINYDKGYSGTAKWKITNVGTKKAYLRAKLYWELDGGGGGQYVHKDSAWAVDRVDYELSPRFGNGIARYSIYTLGRTKENPLILSLGAGRNCFPVGKVEVWDDEEKIYIETRTDAGYRLKETHLYVGSVEPTDSAPGKLGNKHEEIYRVFDSYEIDLPKNIVDGKVYIALHADVQELVPGSGGDSGGDTPDIDLDVEGWTKSDDGYYYYDGIVGPDNKVYFKLDFEVDAEERWSGSCEFWIEAEAVQASNGAKDVVWHDNPIDD
jgi:hypothetical protein